jgi:heat shock protein HslJ
MAHQHAFFSKSRSEINSTSSSDGDELTCSDSTSYEGKWKLIKAFENGDKVSIPLNDAIIFEFQEVNDDSMDYMLGIKAANSFGTSFNITGKKNDCFDKIDVDLVVGTLMYPPEEFLPIEDFLSVNLENMSMIKSFEKMGKNILLMKGDSARLYCKYIPPEPVYEGEWKITSATYNGTEVSIPDDDDIVMKLVGKYYNPTSYNWYAKATNTFRTSIDIIGPYDDEYDLIAVGPGVASTRMFPEEKYMDIEMFFNTALVTMNKVKKYQEEGKGEMLMMMGDDAEMKCEEFIPPPDMYLGKWKLTKAMNGTEEVTFPDDETIVMGFQLTKEEGTYTFYAVVANKLWTTVDIVGQANDGYDEIEVGMVASTYMAVPEELQNIEYFLGTALETMDKMKSFVEDDKKLVMKNDNGAKLYADWME